MPISTQHETFIFKQFEGTDFKFDTHSYSSRNIQTRFLLDSGMMILGLQKITISTELYSKENNITRAFNKINLKVKV